MISTKPLTVGPAFSIPTSDCLVATLLLELTTPVTVLLATIAAFSTLSRTSEVIAMSGWGWLLGVNSALSDYCLWYSARWLFIAELRSALDAETLG